MTITAVTDHGRLHLGYGDTTQGMGKSIRIHRDPLTLLYAYLTANLVKVEINGECYLANRNSFNKHLTSIGLKNISLMTDRVAYAQLIKGKKLQLSDESLAEGLSFEKRTELTSNLAYAIIANDVECVKKCIREGADLDRRFYVEYWPLPEKIIHAKIYMNRPSNFIFYKAFTPLAYAIRCNISNAANIANIISKTKKGDYASDVCIWYRVDDQWSHDLKKHKVTYSEHVVFEGNKLALKKTEDFDIS